MFNFHRPLVVLIALPVVAALSACVLTPTESNPIVGMWNWRHVSGACTEIHFYKGNGDSATWSAKEVLRKSYQISPVEPGLFRVDTVVTESNDQQDCLGVPTPVGAKSTYYIRLLNNGGYFTCHTANSLSCDGTATRRERL